MNINEIIAIMPKAKYPSIHFNPDNLIAYWNIWDKAILCQCKLLIEQGWTPPIEPIPEHCSSHTTFQDDCQGCQGVTGQIKCYDGKYHDIDWASFNLGQEIMLDQGYQKVEGVQ